MSGPSNESDQEALVPMEIDVRPDQFDAIQEIAARTGTDRSTVVRRLLDLGITQSRQSDNDADSKKPL